MVFQVVEHLNIQINSFFVLQNVVHKLEEERRRERERERERFVAVNSSVRELHQRSFTFKLLKFFIV